MQRKFIAIILLLLSLRYAFFFWTNQKLPDGHLRVNGEISSEPTLFDTSQKITVHKFDMYIPRHPSLSLGDTVIVEGEAKDGSIKRGTLISYVPSSSPLYLFRKKMLDFYASVLPENIAELVAGAVLGSKALLTSSFWNSLTQTGTAHVVVASGMNVAIISKFILDVLIHFLPRKKALAFTFICVWLYALIAGFGPPIVRAAIMGSLSFTAQEFGKLSNTLRTFWITCTVMLLYNPEWLWDISFLLTCTATLSIMILQKPIEEKFKKVPAIIRGDLTTSLAASVGVSPILWWNFGQFNLLSPIINAMVLWTIAPLTILGSIAGILGVAFLALGKLLLYLIYPFAWWFTTVVALFS
jgi:competence protein ComEC